TMDHLADTTGVQTVEVTCQRSVGGSNFPAGVQDFNWTIARPNVWSPADSYFVVEAELLGKGDPTLASQPKVSELLALAENFGASLYTNAYFHCGGQVVSSVTQYHAQIGALNARIGNTAAWAKSVGYGAYNDNASFSERCAAVSRSSIPQLLVPSTAPNAIPVMSISYGKNEAYKPTQPGAFGTATIQIDATGVVLGVGTNFTLADVGAYLCVRGRELLIISSSPTTGLILRSQANDEIKVGDATTEWYIVRRNASRTTQAHNKVQVIFRPPLGIFGSNVLMGPGSYKISLSPDSNYRFSAVESKNTDAKGLTPGVGANSPYTLNILDVRFYATTAQKLLPE
ncbi:MAG TPA: hypothetical protein VLA31_04815, partial [Burkholderiaceae bacterium]|nr:hypothetical protein [Burkholderiaceae bacterium]